jgi:hypothetical protein
MKTLTKWHSRLFRPSVDAFKAILTRDLTLPEENHVFWYVTKIGEERPEGWWWKKASKTWDERVYLELLQWNKGQTGFSKTTEELKIKTWTNWLSIPISAFF